VVARGVNGTRTVTEVPFPCVPITLKSPPRGMALSFIPTSQRLGVRSLMLVNALTVVVHFEDELIAVFNQTYVHVGRLSMAHNVTQRFLKDTEHGNGALWAESDLFFG
jgi:hypothetical protein